MIKEVKGDILQAREDIIGHQVNCKGVMGAGLARQIKNKYKEVYQSYKRECESVKKSKLLLGHTLIVDVGRGKYVANLFSQDGFGKDKRYTDYTSLRISLMKLEKYARKNNLTVALPYGLGSGLAGGDWEKVYKIIEEVFVGNDVVLYEYN